jgi:multiple sugar transport system ATP-binding protein
MPENLFVAGFIGSPSMNFFRGCIEDGRFLAPGLSLKIPHNLLESAIDRPHENISLGVRPECFSTVPNEFSEGIPANVVVNEFLGDRSLVYLKIGNTEHVASLKEDLAHCIDHTVMFYIDMDRAHFFDPVTEQRIRREKDRT